MEYALVARWLVGYGLLGAAGYPIAARLLSGFRDRGAGFALPVALVVLTTVVYWVGHLSFGPTAFAAGVVALLGASAAAGLDWGALREGNLRPAAAVTPNPSLRPATESAAVFVAAFLFLVAVRAADPAVHAGGGEKFLDYGLLNSLLRATVLPPEDMWFAGEPVRYYYGGHLMAATLAELTFTPARYAYNLALAGFYAMLVTAAYALAAAVADARNLPGSVAGLGAAFAVGFASNLVTAGRFVLLTLPEPYRTRIAERIAATSEYTVEAVLSGARSFSYWSASRVIPGTINEFPLFSWLNGDLHAHMMGTPFLLLAAALSFAYFRAPEADRRRRRALVFGAVPVVGGLQAVVDTWSYPSVFGVLFLSLVLAPARPSSLLPAGAARWVGRLDTEGSRAVRELVRVAAALGATAVSAGLSIPFALPFLLGPATGAGADGRHLAVLAASDRSALGALLLVHGAFVAAFLVYLVARLRVRRPLPLLAGFAVVAAVAVVENLAVLLVAGPLLVLGWVALRLDRPVGYETVLVVAGAGLMGLVELVYVSEQAGPGRMNTVFKTYIQVWVLWGPALGVVFAGLVWGPNDRADAAPPGGRLPDQLAPLRRAWTPEVRTTLAAAFVAVLILSTSVYGVLALNNHFARASDPTLDATAFVEREHPDVAPAIRWLDDRPGQPTLVSAPGTAFYPGEGDDPRPMVMYTWSANPAASLTGVPTVAGWAHEVGYRGPDAYYARVRDVDTIYTNLDRRAELLRKYDVEYVWVGPSERTRYGDQLVTFGQLSGVRVAYEAPAVTVYRVDQSRLPGGDENES